MSTKVTIYGLADPRDALIKYVGQTWNLSTRAKSHIALSRRGYGVLSAKDRWIRGLEALGLTPVVLILGECCEQEAAALEAAHIEEAKKNGPVYNLIDYQPHARLKLRTVIVHVPMSDSDRNRYDVASQCCGTTLAQWIRDACDMKCRE